MLIVACTLPWSLGTAAILAFAKSEDLSESGAIAWAIGCGWFAGSFFVTLLMRAFSLAGIPFGVVSLAGLVAVAAFGFGALCRRRHAASLRPAFSGAMRALAAPDLAGWRRAAWLALLAWIALRFALLLLEVVWVPMYPWDSWSQWATKARVWYELKSLVPFVGPDAWAAATGVAYTDAAPNYPATIPLLQVWTAVCLGRWDDSLVNLPWWLCGVAFAAALYGFLADRFRNCMAALAGTWLVVSLPIVNVHIALAGYADLPLAAFLTLGVLAGLRACERRRWTDTGLAVLFIAAVVLTKNPGKAWLAVLIPGVLAATVPTWGRRLGGICLVAVVVAMAVVARVGANLLGYRIDGGFTFPWRGLVDAFFIYENWNLLWFGAIFVAALGWRHLLSKRVAPLTFVVAGGLLLLLFGFSFTNAWLWVEDQSTVNRAALHLAPLLTVWMLLVFFEWATQQADVAKAAALIPVVAGPIPVAAPMPMTARHVTTAARLPASTESVAPAAPIPESTISGAGVTIAVGSAAPENFSKPGGVRRNDPCPCGSGKRYKHCHGAVADGFQPSSNAPRDADALTREGLAAHQRGDLDSAERAYRAALEISPVHPHAMHYLGVVHYQRRLLDEALPLLDRSVAAIPDEPEFHNNRGLALAAADRSTEAIEAHRRALALAPQHSGAWNNLGLAEQSANHVPEAIAAFRGALERDPTFAQAHWNLALALLANGDFPEGWSEYEWRFRIPELTGTVRAPALPRWDGTFREGMRLLVIAEQGMGDVLQFVRYARIIAERGVRVTVAAPQALLGLIASVPRISGVISADGVFAEYDAYTWMMSLPGILGMTPLETSASVPYLHADPALLGEAASAVLPFTGALKVGLAWSGNPKNTNDFRRSIPLARLAPLLTLRGIEWFSIQRAEDERDIDAVPEAATLQRLALRRNFDGAAALMSKLDLVISVETSFAHLAGALGRPVWVLVPFAPDFRWRPLGPKSQWYPTARIFRQAEVGDWNSVVTELAQELPRFARVAAARNGGDS